MAMSGPLRVECDEVFPHGVGVMGAVTPLADFDASTRENRVQARDKVSGLPVWVVDVIDFDPGGTGADVEGEGGGVGAAGAAGGSI